MEDETKQVTAVPFKSYAKCLDSRRVATKPSKEPFNAVPAVGRRYVNEMPCDRTSRLPDTILV